jgi:outer membrane protein assembly factor BamB
MHQSRLFLVLFVGFHFVGSALAQAPFGWRGDGTGCFPNAQPALEWSPKKNILWKTALPGGSPASPVLAGDRVFVLSDPALLIAVNAADGKILWQRGHGAADVGGAVGKQVSGSMPSYNPDGDAGSAASTPVTDGKDVYAVFANGVVSAHSVAGERRWLRFVEKPKVGYGFASSPLLAGDKLVLHLVDLIALDSKSGKEVWRLPLPAAHASPVATSLGGVDLIVHPAGTIIRVSDGKVLAEKLFHLTQSSPTIDEGVIYAHENGKVKALQLPERATEKMAVKQLWETDFPRAQYQVASPVIHQGYLYGVNMNGILQVIDCKTGKSVYNQRVPFQSRAYTSITRAGGHLFLADQTGKTLVLQPGPKYQPLFVNALDYHPSSFVFSGKKMFVRMWRHVYCVGE